MRSLSIQGTGSDSPFQGHGEAGRVPGGSRLPIVLAMWRTGRSIASHAYNALPHTPVVHRDFTISSRLLATILLERIGGFEWAIELFFGSC
jgi:hypothetical protein